MPLSDYVVNMGGGNDNAMDEMCGGFQLTRTQRFYGFGICFGLGFLITVLSSLSLAFGNILGFAFLYTVGNITSLVSTGFLIGFSKQFKKMFDKSRVVSTVIYLVAIVATVLVAVLTSSGQDAGF